MKYTNINEVIAAQNTNKALLTNTKAQIKFLTSILKAQASLDTTDIKVPGISNEAFKAALGTTTTGITEALDYYKENLKKIQKAQSKLRRVGRHLKAIEDIEEDKEAPKAKKATKKAEAMFTTNPVTGKEYYHGTKSEKKASTKKATTKKATTTKKTTSKATKKETKAA